MMMITIFVYHCPLLVRVPVLKNKFKKGENQSMNGEKILTLMQNKRQFVNALFFARQIVVVNCCCCFFVLNIVDTIKVL